MRSSSPWWSQSRLFISLALSVLLTAASTLAHLLAPNATMTTTRITRDRLNIPVPADSYADGIHWARKDQSIWTTAYTVHATLPSIYSAFLAESRPELTTPRHAPAWLGRLQRRARPDDLRMDIDSHTWRHTVIERGWPFRCVWGFTATRHSGRYDRVDETIHRGTLDQQSRYPIVYLPIWTGIIVNLTTHLLSVYGLLTGIAVARAARRHRQGRCSHCNYNLHHDHAAGCPECGWNRSAPEAEHARA